MSRTGIIIQARMGSARLPGKVLEPLYGDVSMLEHLVGKCNGHHVVIAIPDTDDNHCLWSCSAEYDTPCFVFGGPEQDVLTRYIQAAEYHKFDTIIRVTADNPLTQIGYFWNLTKKLQPLQWDYMTLWLDGKPAPVHGAGLFPEAVTLGALKSLDVILDADDPQREHVTQGIYTRPDLFRLQKVENRRFENLIRGGRWTVDTPEDLERMRGMFRDNPVGWDNDMEKVALAYHGEGIR